MVKGNRLLDRDTNRVVLVVKVAKEFVEMKIEFPRRPVPFRIKIVYISGSSVHVVERSMVLMRKEVARGGPQLDVVLWKHPGRVLSSILVSSRLAAVKKVGACEAGRLAEKRWCCNRCATPRRGWIRFYL